MMLTVRQIFRRACLVLPHPRYGMKFILLYPSMVLHTQIMAAKYDPQRLQRFALYKCCWSHNIAGSMMAYRLSRMLLFSLCSDVAKNGRNTWNSFRSCCTCLQRPNDHPKQQFTVNSRNCLVNQSGVKQTARRNHKTLPSDFNAQLPSLKQMEHFLSSRKVLFQHGHTSLIASCPFCASKEEETDNAKTFTLYINKTTGSHFCNNCGSSGSWRQFKVRN